MSTKPSDTEIIGLLASRRGSTMPTYFIKNCLRTAHPGLQTAWVLRRLKALEKAGLVQQQPSNYAAMLCWAVADRAAAQQAAEKDGAA